MSRVAELLFVHFHTHVCYVPQTPFAFVRSCVYDGTICFDGDHPVAVVDEVYNAPGLAADPNVDCIDYRHLEPSSWEYSNCRYDSTGERKYDWTLPDRPATDTPVGLVNRYFGPANRKEVVVRAR